MSLHLGLHWDMIAGRLPDGWKNTGWKNMGWKGMGLDVLAVLAAGCGLHLFLVRDISSYLFLTTQFAFLDYDNLNVGHDDDVRERTKIRYWKCITSKAGGLEAMRQTT